VNKDQFARLERHRKVKQSLTDWQAADDAVPAFKEVADVYLGQLVLLDGTARKRPVTSQGATQANTRSSESLIPRAVKAANALWLLYRKEKDTEAAAKLYRTPSDYRNLPDLEQATVFLSVSQQLTARIVDLARGYNLTPDFATQFATDAKALDDSLEKPQLAIDDQKLKGANARTTLQGLNRYLKDDFRAGLELLKDTRADAYNAIREACQVDDAAYRRRKAKKAGGSDS
jgi:hypothetical protein